MFFPWMKKHKWYLLGFSDRPNYYQELKPNGEGWDSYEDALIAMTSYNNSIDDAYLRELLKVDEECIY